MTRRSARVNNDLKGAGSVVVKKKCAVAKVKIHKGLRGPNKTREFDEIDHHVYSVQCKDSFGRVATHKIIGFPVDGSTADIKDFVEKTNAAGYNVMKMIGEVSELLRLHTSGLPLPEPVWGHLPDFVAAPAHPEAHNVSP